MKKTLQRSELPTQLKLFSTTPVLDPLAVYTSKTVIQHPMMLTVTNLEGSGFILAHVDYMLKIPVSPCASLDHNLIDLSKTCLVVGGNQVKPRLFLFCFLHVIHRVLRINRTILETDNLSTKNRYFTISLCRYKGVSPY